MRVVVAVVSLLVAFALGCERRVAGGKADGALVFQEACSRCHGPIGQPAMAEVIRLGVKDLSQPELQDRMSDAEIENQIRNGSKNQNMPAFGGALSEAQVAAVIRHVRTLRLDAGPL